MQSAWLLCRALARERDVLLGGAVQAAVAREYAREWRRQFAARVRFAAVLAQLAMRPRQARPLLPLLRAAPGLLTVAARLGCKVKPLETLTATLAGNGRQRERARTMVAAAVPRLGDKQA